MDGAGIGRNQGVEFAKAVGDRTPVETGREFADKVMQIENDYDKEVYNGDLGYVEDVEPDDVSMPPEARC
jgi:exodeoxyribonuclease V alpha subunit